MAKGIWKTISHHSKSVSICRFEESMEYIEKENTDELQPNIPKKKMSYDEEVEMNEVAKL